MGHKRSGHFVGECDGVLHLGLEVRGFRLAYARWVFQIRSRL